MQQEWAEAFFMVVIILVLLFVVHLFIYKTIARFDTIYLAEKTEQELRRLLELQKEQYSAIEEKLRENQIIRHDLRHHMNLLAAMLSNRDFEEALSYIQKFNQYNLEAVEKKYCENAVVNAVLSSHLRGAAQRGIRVSCRAVLPQEAGIDEVELCIVLSNLLENAIEHCCGKEETPLLDISVKKNRGQVCIRIENSFDGRLLRDKNGDYISEKPQGGIGCKSVSMIVEKHHGVLNISHTENVFTVDVAL